MNSIQDFPWQTVYDERLGLGGDVAWMEEHIRHLRYTADQLEPRLAAMRLRLNHLHDVTEYNENRPRRRCNHVEGHYTDPHSGATCSDCGAAPDAPEDEPGHLCECTCPTNVDNPADYIPCPTHDHEPGYAEGRAAGLDAANGALLTVLNFWREGPQSADMRALLADVQRVYDFNERESKADS